MQSELLDQGRSSRYQKFQPYFSREIEDLYNSSTQPREKRYRIALQGLHCSSCVHRLEQLPISVPQILNARVDFSRSQIFIAAAPDFSLGQILTILEDMGYPGQPLQPSESSGDRLRLEDRDILKRLAVAGACSGNIMLFTIPIYGGLAGELGETFKLLSFAIFMPILFYSAVPLYRSAWSALKFRQLNVDTPLVIALWSGFLASLGNFVRGSENLYLDSTAGFIFLILCSRWFLRVSQHRWIESPLSLSPWKSELVTVQNASGTQYIQASKLAAQMVYQVQRQQVVPVDSILKSERALFDTSWMTGESTPRVYHREMPVPAGYRCLTKSIDLCAVSELSSSELAKSLRRIEDELRFSSRKLNLFDQTARNLLIGVFILGGLLLAGAPLLGISPESAFERALSLLIVACPCALAFGGPLAYGMSLRKAADQGVLVRNPDVLDRVAECKTIVFDKTGTLTEGNLRLVQHTPEQISDGIKNIILSLEKGSTHPVANAFRLAWASHEFQPIHLQDVHEIAGEKIYGLHDARVYCLRAAQDEFGLGLTVALLQDDQEIARFVFDDEIRPEAREILSQLMPKYTLQILSGDRNNRVQRVIFDLHIAGLTGMGDCSPAKKAEIVKGRGHCLMVGDGINDVEALASSHVGIAMNGAIEHGLLHGSGYFLKPGLQPLLALLNASQKARQLTRTNLTFALAYNLAAGFAAILGWVNPLTAAVLMPISSGIIVFVTWRASR